MNTIKKTIVEEIKKSKQKFSAVSIEDLNDEFFLQDSSLRLTYIGYMQIKEVFTPYIFELDCDIKSKHLINLAKTMRYPYYLSRSKLVLFSDSDAVLIKLYGSLSKFLEHCS